MKKLLLCGLAMVMATLTTACDNKNEGDSSLSVEGTIWKTEIDLTPEELGMEGEKCYSAIYFGAQSAVINIFLDETLVDFESMPYTQNGQMISIINNWEEWSISAMVSGDQLTVQESGAWGPYQKNTEMQNTDLGMVGTKWSMSIYGEELQVIFERNIVSSTDGEYSDAVIYTYENCAGSIAGMLNFEIAGDYMLLDGGYGTCLLGQITTGTSPSNKTAPTSIAGTTWESKSLPMAYAQMVLSPSAKSRAAAAMSLQMPTAAELFTPKTAAQKLAQTAAQTTSTDDILIFKFDETNIEITFPGEEPVTAGYIYSNGNVTMNHPDFGIIDLGFVAGDNKMLAEFYDGVYFCLTLIK